MRLLLLEPVDRHSDVVEGRGAVYLVVQRLDLALFQRAGHRLEGGQVLADLVGAMGAQPTVVLRDARGGGLHGVHVPPEVEVGVD